MSTARIKTHDPKWDAEAKFLASLPRDVFEQRIKDLAPTKQDLWRVKRFRYDFLGFVKYMLPQLANLPFTAMHREFAKLVDKPAKQRKLDAPKTGERILKDMFIAPRGQGKTFFVRLFMMHSMLYDLEEGFVVVADSSKSAKTNVITPFVDMMKSSKPLKRMYGDWEVHRDQQNNLTFYFEGREPYGLKEGGMDGRVQLRGYNVAGRRPTCIILDDAERDQTVRNAVLVAQGDDFLKSTIMSLGPQEGGLRIVWTGTAIAANALIEKYAKAADWRTRRFRAVISWPDNSDLWDRCKEIYIDTTGDEGTGMDAAFNFYKANKKAMDGGAKVLAPAAMPIYSCYRTMWDLGSKAFATEQQNDVSLISDRYFDTEQFTYCDFQRSPKGYMYDTVVNGVSGATYNVRSMVKVAVMDPITGRAVGESGDYCAIVIMALSPDLSAVYVLDVFARQALSVDGQIEALLQFSESHGVTHAFIEDIGFQAVLVDTFNKKINERKQQAARGSMIYHNLQAHGLDNGRMNKYLHIQRQQGPIENGWLQFSQAFGETCKEQYNSFPNGTHDDIPDAVSMGLRALERYVQKAHARILGSSRFRF